MNVHVHVRIVAQPSQICLPLRVLDPPKSAQLLHGGMELVCWERTWAFWEWICVLWEGMGAVWVLYGCVRALYGCVWVLHVCCMGAVWVEMGDVLMDIG